jgi:hypothetical protein
MRARPRHLLLVALALACGWIAAPALSAQRYLPEAVDFEQALPALRAVDAPAGRAAHGHDNHAGQAERRLSFITPVITAPERFDLVGLARELRPIELRARDRDGAWTAWIETANGDPVYFGGADQVQLRTRGWRPRGRLHYVNVSGTTSELGGLLSGLRRSINSAFISASGAFVGAAEAAPVRPTVISRAAWGADQTEGGCRPRGAPDRGKVKAAAVHHTVSATDYSEAEAPGVVLGICRYHRNGQGWNDIGYNALVDRFGNLYEGRAGGLQRAVVGAHAQGFNAQTTGIAAIGTHTSTPITPQARRSLVSYLAWKLARHRVNARGKTTMVSAGGDASRYAAGRRVRTHRIIGHGTVGLTACPGEALEAELIKLRRQAQKRIDASGGVTTPPPTTPPPTGGTDIPR